MRAHFSSFIIKLANWLLGCVGLHWCLVPGACSLHRLLLFGSSHVTHPSGPLIPVTLFLTSNPMLFNGGCVYWSLLMLLLIDDGLVTGVFVLWSGDQLCDLDTGYPPHCSHHDAFLQKHGTPVRKLLDVGLTCIHMAMSHLCLLIK